MTRIEKARWANALKIAHRINELIDQGYVVRDQYDYKVPRLDIGENCVLMRLSENSCRVLLSTEDGWDSCLVDTVAETNAYFAAWTAVHPKDIMKVIK